MKKLLRIAISLVLVAASVGIALFLAWPSYRELVDLQKQVQERKTRVARGEQVIQEFEQVLAEVDRRRLDFDKLESAFPADPGVPALFDHIQQLASSSGLLLESITMREAGSGRQEEKQTVFQEIRLDVRLRGPYEGAKNFLAAARRSARLLNVDAVNFQSSGDENNPNLEITCSISAFAKGQPSL